VWGVEGGVKGVFLVFLHRFDINLTVSHRFRPETSRVLLPPSHPFHCWTSSSGGGNPGISSRFTVGGVPGLWPPAVHISDRKVRKVPVRRCRILRKGAEKGGLFLPKMMKRGL